MKLAPLRERLPLQTLLLTGFLAIGPALAGHGQAPIAYRGADAGEGPQQSRAAEPGPQDEKRIVFRYPDQPDRVYDANGSRPAESDAPIAFSSSEAAIEAERARRYAHTRTPAAGRPNAGGAQAGQGFDARATAARIAASDVAGQDGTTQTAGLGEARDSARSSARAGYSRRGAAMTPAADPGYDETGIASWYGPGFHGKPTANGEIFDQATMTAAHPSLPLPSLVQVINLDNGREVVLRVNDRGPFIEGRMIDVSRKAAETLGFREAGEAKVRVRYLGEAPVIARSVAGSAAGERAAGDEKAVVERALPAPKAASPTASPVRATQRPAKAPRRSRGSGHHFVQLGAFSNIANAERLSRSLSASMPVDVREARVDGADFFRVWVGPFPSRSRARQIRDELGGRGFDRGIVIAQP